MNPRAKGLIYSREVRHILEGIGHRCDGPFFRIAYFNDKINVVHIDILDLYDLISFYEGKLIGHQVSVLDHKSEKIKDFRKLGLPGWLWLRFHNEDQGTGFQVFEINRDKIVEHEMNYGLWRKPKITRIERDGLT